MTGQKDSNDYLPCRSLNQSCLSDFGNHMLFGCGLNVLMLNKTVSFS